jgi:hypothetical protein
MGPQGPAGPDVFADPDTGAMKVCVGLVRFGGRAANPQPDQNYMMVVPANWTRQACNAMFAAYAGPAENGARGGVVRVGCMFPDDMTVTWEGDPRFNGAACGW